MEKPLLIEIPFKRDPHTAEKPNLIASLLPKFPILSKQIDRNAGGIKRRQN